MSGSQYEYKVQLTSPIGKLKQGFNVSLEVTKDDDALLVPVTAVTKKGSTTTSGFTMTSQKSSRSRSNLAMQMLSNKKLPQDLKKVKRLLLRLKNPLRMVRP
ncbi:MAG: efflux RND transporter periplasmic adaptor subunit [Streptococcus salivarius]